MPHPFLKTFKIAPPREPVLMFWGGGHTQATLPTLPQNGGWRCRRVHENNNLWIMGRPGHEGCVSMQLVERRTWNDLSSSYDTRTVIDVAIYEDLTPQTIVAAFKADRAGEKRDVLDSAYRDYGTTPGIGLKILRDLKADIAEWEAYKKKQA